MALLQVQSGGPVLEWAAMETDVAAAEATERVYDRGGRPKTQFARPSGQLRPITDAIPMERVLHNDG